jgi:hypothetical protein
MGDFNVDLEKYGDRTDYLFKWIDGCGLTSFAPDRHTFLRSERIIDYAFASGIEISVQTYEVSTRSDHTPILDVLTCERCGMFSLYSCHTHMLLGNRNGWIVIMK